MPYGDRRGPDGFGPRTGRGLGFCNGYDSPGYTKDWGRRFAGRGYGRGAGFGRGYGRGYGRGAGWGVTPYAGDYRPPTKEEEKQMIKDEYNALKERMEILEKQMNKGDDE